MDFEPKVLFCKGYMLIHKNGNDMITWHCLVEVPKVCYAKWAGKEREKGERQESAD